MDPSHNRYSINEDTVDPELPSHAGTVASVESSAENQNWDDGSFSSGRKIVRTTEWKVEYQPRRG